MTDKETTPTLVEINKLAVRRHGDTLLADVSLRVHRGSLHVLVGPNGAGKSTLLLALLGQIPFDGQVALNWIGSGTIGYVPQTFPVDPTLPVTVEDFLALTRQRRPVCMGISSSTRQIIKQLLNRVGLSGLEKRLLAVLSGGELKRVLLAHALDPEPELLLLDEPTSGLDEASVRRLEETLLELKLAARTTVVMVSHNLEQVRRIADQVTVLDQRIVAEGPASDILTTTNMLEMLPTSRDHRVI